MKSTPFTCFNIWHRCIAVNPRGELPSYCRLLFPSLRTGPQCSLARQSALTTSVIPQHSRLPREQAFIFSMPNPMAISLSKFKSLLKDLKQKIPLLFLEALCTFFSCCQKRRGRRSPVSSFQRPARAFPGLCSKPWQTSKADTDGSCLEWWRQNQTTSGPKFLSSQAEEEVVRTQPITPQNGNLRCPKLKGINSTAKPLGRSGGCFSFSLSQQRA